MLHYGNAFQLTVRVYPLINLFFLCQLKTKSNLQFSFSHLDPVSLFLFPLGRILLRMTHTAFFYRDRRRLQTIREKCVLLICDTFGVLWFLSLEYVIFLLF